MKRKVVKAWALVEKHGLTIEDACSGFWESKEEAVSWKLSSQYWRNARPILVEIREVRKKTSHNRETR